MKPNQAASRNRIVTNIKDALKIINSGEPVKITPHELGVFIDQLETSRLPVCLRFDYDNAAHFIWISLWKPEKLAKPTKFDKPKLTNKADPSR